MIVIHHALAAVAAILSGVIGGTACTHCDAECAGPEVVVGVDAAAEFVELCQEGDCTMVEVASNVRRASDTVSGVFIPVRAGAEDLVEAQIRVLGSDGGELTAVELDEALPDGECGCTDPIVVAKD